MWNFYLPYLGCTQDLLVLKTVYDLGEIVALFVTALD